MLTLYDQNAPKKLTNLSINSDLLKKANELEINLSTTLEQALTNLLKAKHAQQWLEQNKSAIATYNKPVDENGAFGDGLRGF